MKKLIVLIALVAFIGVNAVPVSAASSTVSVEMVKNHGKDDKKDDKKAAKTEKSDCKENSDCCKSKCSDKKAKKESDKKS